MSRLDDITSELTQLLTQVGELIGTEQKDFGLLIYVYESWYTRALAAISQIIPERVQDFRTAYKLEKRKTVDYSTYTIHDYLLQVGVTRAGVPEFDPKQAYTIKVANQAAILQAAIHAAPSALRDIRTVLHAELLDKDVDAARALVKAKHLRSAGVVCGVALESHLKAVADRHGITIRKANPTIADLNDQLKDTVYDVPTWRLIQRLGDIRNLCGHSKEREPRLDEVEDLITGTDKVLREIL